MSALTTTFDRTASEVGSYYQEWKPFDQRPGYTPSADPFETCRPVSGDFKFVITPAAGKSALDVAFAVEKLVQLSQAEVTKPSTANGFNPACIKLSGKSSSNKAWDILSKRPDLIAKINGFAIAARPETKHRSQANEAKLNA